MDIDWIPFPATLVMPTVPLASFQIITEIKKSIIQLSKYFKSILSSFILAQLRKSS